MERQLIYELEKLILLGNHLQIQCNPCQTSNYFFFFFAEIEKPVLKAMGPSIVKVILKAHKLEVSHFEIFKLQSSVVIRTV